MAKPGRYQVFAAKTRTATPRLIAKNVMGQKAAIAKARSHHEKTGHLTGVYQLYAVKAFGTTPRKK